MIIVKRHDNHDNRGNVSNNQIFTNSKFERGMTHTRGTKDKKTRYHNSYATTFSIGQHVVGTTLYPWPCVQQRGLQSRFILSLHE